MEIPATRPSAETFSSIMAPDPATWIQACTGNVEMAARAAELVYGCFRTIAAQQAALANRVMRLATNGGAAHPVRPPATALSYQSCDMVIGSLIEALETVRQASLDIQRLMLPETDRCSGSNRN
jgi:hypothetical protein